MRLNQGSGASGIQKRSQFFVYLYPLLTCFTSIGIGVTSQSLKPSTWILKPTSMIGFSSSPMCCADTGMNC